MSDSDGREKPGHMGLRVDQAPPAGADELAAIKAVMNARADAGHQAVFVRYLLKMTGVPAGETFSVSDRAGAFTAGKRWIGTTLLTMGEIELVPLGVRKALEAKDG